MSDPVAAVAGYFPALRPTAKPTGGPIPDRTVDRDGAHTPRRHGYRDFWRGRDGRQDGNWIYAEGPY